MKQNVKMRKVFWAVTSVLFLFNIIGVIVFREYIRTSANTLVATLFFLFVFIRGIVACFTKDVRLLQLSKINGSGFYRYGRPTVEQLTDFYGKATICFAVMPFYLPLAVFSSNDENILWSVFLLLAPQLVLAGIAIRKIRIERKEQKRKDALLEMEKEAQEKREELGRWK